MINSATAIEAITPLGHELAMRLATVEYDRLLAVVDELRDDDWSRPTDCTEWDVRAVLGHILGALELQADPDERMRQMTAAARVAAQTGGLRIDALTALQVSEHRGLTTDQLKRALHEMTPRGLGARRGTTQPMRDAPYDAQLPGESGWTVGYLFDVILTRDPWIHRIDICRAIGSAPDLSSDHDGRIVADVVADWARHHHQPFMLTLSGPAGGAFIAGHDGDDFHLDAVEFCRTISGRERATGLLATRVIF
ncbi:MAG: maleylpyruvate isomerase family mycothiol-dependent enzyme [Candidatus Dormibacteria bacterium]